MEFQRLLSIEEACQWDSLSIKVQDTHLNDSSNTVRWAMEKSGVYITKLIYRHASQGSG
jgi:hypothetical protein